MRVVPPELKAIVDERAGKEHSENGAVMQCLAEVLEVHRQMLAQEWGVVWQGSVPEDGELA